jgi:hypothetical protein
MKKTTLRFLTSWPIAAVVALACLVQSAKAGWTGSMNGLGNGWASVNVTASNVITGILTSNLVNCPSNHAPSASMVATIGYIAGGPLPDGASAGTVALIKGTNGYKWTAKTTGANNDKTDNAKLDSLVKVDPSDCATLEIDTSADISPDGKSGVLHVNTKATPGTALLLRGYEYKDPTPPSTTDELETNKNSLLKWQTLMVGPFDLNSSNCTGVNIPFTIETSISNLYFVVDGEAKSLPIALYCPTNVIAHCGESVVYPPAYYSACGEVTVTYNPSADFSFPIGTTPVTITIKDQYGNSTNCTFAVTVVDDTKPVVPILADVVGQCSAQVPTATTIDICGIYTNTITGTTADPKSYSAQGTYVVHWSFDDGQGNISTATQNVIVKDTTPPVKPTLASLNYGTCSTLAVTPPTPTTTDNCAGPVSGTPDITFPITTLGTTVVTWTFNDGNGNTTTATQNVTLGGLTFKGFYAPIGGAGGTCDQPVVTANKGSVVPIKFDISCGSTLITSGTPPRVKIQAYSNNCVAGASLADVNAVYQNDWHFNWDTTGWAKGTYKVLVVMPDGSSQFVFVKLK